MTVIRNYSHTRVCAAYTDHSYYPGWSLFRSELLFVWLLSRVALIPLRAFVCVATIQGGPYSTQSFCLCGYYPGWSLFCSELLFVWLLFRVALIPLRAFVCVATIQGWHRNMVCNHGISKNASCTVSDFDYYCWPFLWRCVH